jgi:hypothetical protein
MNRYLRFTLGLLAAALLAAPAARAADKPRPVPANPLLEDHSNFFKPVQVYDLQTMPVCQQKLAPLSYKIYSAVGFNLANTIVLVGPDGGLVVVDTLGSDGTAKAALEAIRRKAGLPAGKLPIKAVIYTHNHIDHTAGVQGVLELADRPACPAEDPETAGPDGPYIGRQDCVEIVAQHKVVDSVVNTATVVGEAINGRSSYMYGSWIGANRVNDGIGPEVLEGKATFQMPSRTFTDELLLSAAGLSMELAYVPSETDDELSVFLPDGMNQSYRGAAPAAPPSAPAADGWGGPGLLLSAEVIQGPSFPNLYSLRGTSYRNPAQWFRSVDKLRAYDSWSMVPAHGVPLCGEDDIRLLLRNFRDAIQFTHDQSVRLLNQGKTPDELVEQIRMPEYLINDLANMKPPKDDVHTEDYLRPFYGSVPQAVREIYFGYLGWFQADPVALHPTAPRELAQRTVKMMGGDDNVVTAANQALAHGLQLKDEGIREKDEAKLRAAEAELEWAAELTTDVIRARGGDDSHGRETAICREIWSKFDGHTPSDQCRKGGTKEGLKASSLPPAPPPCHGEAYCKARETKATAFLAMAELPSNPNWRNWYISSAEELCGVFEGQPPVVGGLTSPQIVAALPPAAWVNEWTMRLKAEVTAPHGQGAQCPVLDESQGGASGDKIGVHQSLGFWFRDEKDPSADQAYGLRIRCAIAAFETLKAPSSAQSLPTEWKGVDLGVSLTHDAWLALLSSMAESVACRDKDPFLTALRDGFKSGGVQVLKGTPAQVESFFGYFDPPQTVFPALTLR